MSCQDDRSIDQHRRCLSDGSYTIPPSFSVHTAIWVGGSWVGGKEKPDGYVYQAKVLLDPKVRADNTEAATQSKFVSVARPKVRGEKRYPRELSDDPCTRCGKRHFQIRQSDGVCKPCLERERRQDAKNAHLLIACSGCQQPFIPRPSHQGGPIQKYCTDRCGHKARKASRPSTQPPLSPRECDQCGAFFQPKPAHMNGLNQRFCSDSHRQQYRRESKKVPA